VENDPNRYRDGKVAVYVRPETARKIRAEAAHKGSHPMKWSAAALSAAALPLNRPPAKAADRREARAIDKLTIDNSPIDTVTARYHISRMDWTDFLNLVERVPGRCSGQWVVKGTRVMVECITNNADSTPEEIADMFGLPVEVVREILRQLAPRK
jgi:uncharacterized protein (DUF433 family)